MLQMKPRRMMVLFTVAINVLSNVISFSVWNPLLHRLQIGWTFSLISPMITAVLLAVLGSLLIRNPVVRIIEDLIQATQQIADGHFSIRVPEAGKGDLRKLLRNFNQMAAGLENVEHMRSDFLSTFSHEFRTPITSICGFAERLREPGLAPDKRTAYLDFIISESRRLAELSNDLLLFFKYQNQNFIGDQETFELDEQILQCIIGLEPHWEARGIRIEVDLPSISYRSNREMLSHVWQNLLDNAVKYSRDGGLVHVSAVQCDGQVEISIQDHGIGMDEETMSHIFEKFYRGATARASSGSGLGLTLVQNIVKLCGGGISVQSRPGEGSTFCVRLPL